MFQPIHIIPTSDNYATLDYDTVYRDYSDVHYKLYDLYYNNVITTFFNDRTPLRALQEVMTYIDAMNCEDKTHRTLEADYKRSADNIRYIAAAGDYKNALGLIIHIAPEPHFEGFQHLPITILEGASELLTPTKKTFVRVFTRNDNPNLLFVWSSKQLTPEQLYKAKMLQNRLNKENIENFNPYTEQIYEAFDELNLEKINRIIEEFFHSDFIQDKLLQNFIEMFTCDRKNEKKRIERQIKSCYKSIKDYENIIASEARKISDLNDRLFTLTYHEEDDNTEIKELYRYLNKHRNIIGMDTENDGINITFESPLIYYTDYAIEKIIKNYDENEKKHKILSLFLNHKDDVELHTICRIKFYPTSFNIEQRGRNDNEKEIINQPHIDRYGCFGNHIDAIEEAAVTHNYVGAIEQINQATMNMNFYDACVANYLLNLLSEDAWNKKQTWLDKKTGEMITTSEAIRRYIDEKTGTNTGGEDELLESLF